MADINKNNYVQRKYPRRPCNFSVGVLYAGTYCVMIARELGEGGMLIETKSKLKPEKNLLITMFLKDTFPFITISRIKYCRKNSHQDTWVAGIEFNQLELSQKRIIRSSIITLS